MSEEGEDLRDHLIKKYGQHAMKSFGDPNSRLQLAGRAVGIEFKTDRKIYPTVMAHSMVEYVKDELKDNDKANKIMEEMYGRYFESGENINDKETLRDVAKKAGLDNEDEVDQVLNNKELKELILKKDMNFKTNWDVHGVPFYIIEKQDSNSRSSRFSGAMPPDFIAQQLKEAASE